MDIGKSLSRKIGPLPAYGWLGIVAGASLFFYKWTGGGKSTATAEDGTSLDTTTPIYAGYPSVIFQGGSGDTTTPPPGNGNGNGDGGGDGGGDDGGGSGQEHPAHPFFPIALDPVTGKYVKIDVHTGAVIGEAHGRGLSHNPNAQNPPPVLSNA